MLLQTMRLRIIESREWRKRPASPLLALTGCGEACSRDFTSRWGIVNPLDRWGSQLAQLLLEFVRFEDLDVLCEQGTQGGQVRLPLAHQVHLPGRRIAHGD